MVYQEKSIFNLSDFLLRWEPISQITVLSVADMIRLTHSRDSYTENQLIGCVSFNNNNHQRKWTLFWGKSVFFPKACIIRLSGWQQPASKMMMMNPADVRHRIQ